MLNSILMKIGEVAGETSVITDEGFPVFPEAMWWEKSKVEREYEPRDAIKSFLLSLHAIYVTQTTTKENRWLTHEL